MIHCIDSLHKITRSVHTLSCPTRRKDATAAAARLQGSKPGEDGGWDMDLESVWKGQQKLAAF
jgi:hypothetical protein